MDAYAAFLAKGIRFLGAGVEDATAVRERVAFALRSFPSVLGEGLGARLDQWLVGALMTVSSAGVYSVALGLCDIILLPSQALGFPLFAAASRSELVSSFPRKPLVIALSLSGVAAIVFAANAWWAIPLVFGDAYRDAVVPAIVIAIGSVALGAQRAIGPYMAGRGRPGLCSLASMTTAVVLAVSVVVLVPRFGLNGAASGSAIAYVTGGTLALWAALRLQSVSTAEKIQARPDSISGEE